MLISLTPSLVRRYTPDNDHALEGQQWLLGKVETIVWVLRRLVITSKRKVWEGLRFAAMAG